MPSKKDRAWASYSESFRKDVLPNLMSSGVTLQLYEGDVSDFDVRAATELGAIMLLDKPLILLRMQGAKLPTRLAKAADAIIEDWSPDNLEAHARLTEAIRRFKPEDNT